MALREELRTNGNYLFKHRGYLPIIIIVVGLMVFVHSTLNNVNQAYMEYYFLACIGVCLLGLILRVMVIGYTGDHTSGRNTSAGQIAEEINQTGFYSMCRHPLYLGNFLMWLGIAMFTANFWFVMAFVFLFSLYYERIMYAEEAFLLDKYGNQYQDFAAKVPAVIPALSKWKKPSHSFSWVKVIRQEKTGVLALAVLIFVFKTIHEYILTGQLIDFTSYWFLTLCFGVLWYTVIKLIQKNTDLLKIDR